MAQSAYSILSDLLSSAVQDPSSGIRDQLSDILDVVLSSSPTKTDTTLASVWAAVLGNCMLALHATDPEKSAKTVSKAWKAAWPLLESQDTEARKAGSQALKQVVQCFTPSLIQAALSESGSQEKKSVIGRIISQTTKAFDVLSFARSIPELLSVVSSLVENLRYRSGQRTSTTAAEQLLLPLITKVGDLRVQKTFEYKEAADATLGTAMRVLGPKVLLKALPLNLEPADRCVHLRLHLLRTDEHIVKPAMNLVLFCFHFCPSRTHLL